MRSVCAPAGHSLYLRTRGRRARQAHSGPPRNALRNPVQGLRLSYSGRPARLPGYLAIDVQIAKRTDSDRSHRLCRWTAPKRPSPPAEPVAFSGQWAVGSGQWAVKENLGVGRRGSPIGGLFLCAGSQLQAVAGQYVGHDIPHPPRAGCCGALDRCLLCGSGGSRDRPHSRLGGFVAIPLQEPLAMLAPRARLRDEGRMDGTLRNGR
jgi:hypothetical protein